ncbi:septal ring lytic transglycosylase RlpA family protein [Rhizobacter sp. LjRoot28]|uniref:septal ring lytic transglycosylase RlpA family protein n=1 Tax=Rhizobacter sp. LjRoot28 TaxID=3342309 RepID=UPI003ED027CC
MTLTATLPSTETSTAMGRRMLARAATLCAALVLAACASGPDKSRDGVEARPPSGLSQVPDAEPRIEPIRPGGPNKPYEVLGKDYVPLREDTRFTERGLASWYGKKFHGRRTASGEVYNMYAMTAAHKTMPIPSYARVRNPANGREIIVRVNDRGPFHRGRVIDLSYTAAMRLGVHNGIAPVEVERITHEDIRTGAWRRNGSAPDDATASAGTPAPAPPRATGGEAAPEIAPTAAPAPSERADTAAAQGYWIQLGAFRQREGAVQFQQRVATELEWLSPLLAVFSEPTLFRLQAGPYPSRGEAASAAERVRDALQLVPVIVEKRR